VRPRLLDLFCGAGGAGEGYRRAGFDVVGVDIKPHDYPCGKFIHDDALNVLCDTAFLDTFDAIHASPPCQAYSTTASLHSNYYRDLIHPVRGFLTGRVYVIENVRGAPMREWVQLCGSSFGLGVRRHRLFECFGFEPGMPPPCAHHLQPEPVDVTGTGAIRLGPRLDGKGGNSRKPRNLAHAREAMGIDWMSRRDLSEAIPPAYTEHLGHQAITQIGATP
jgi:DNA (cytosine-5)-methyltransferase 1